MGSKDTDVLEFLRSIYPPRLFHLEEDSSRSHRPKPFVTLTWAQSLDGKIAGAGGRQIRLSGEESMALTHRLREAHDSILVGVGTVLNDDPQLTARLPDLLPLDSQPRPIILDTKLRTPSTSKLLANHKKGLGKQPVIFASSHEANETRRKKIEQAGAKVITCDLERDERISLTSIVSSWEVGRSLMVEGGASVITAFLSTQSTFAGEPLVDLVIITIAPILVGDGTPILPSGTIPPELEHIVTKQFGQDAVVVCRIRRAPFKTL